MIMIETAPGFPGSNHRGATGQRLCIPTARPDVSARDKLGLMWRSISSTVFRNYNRLIGRRIKLEVMTRIPLLDWPADLFSRDDIDETYISTCDPMATLDARGYSTQHRG
jgi:hypothetical protein